MGKKALTLIAALGFLCACKKSQSPDAAATAAAAAVSDAKVILDIDGSLFTNQNLKDFIELQYEAFSANQEDPALFSLLYNLFVEQKLVLHAANREAISVDDAEVAEYLSRISLVEANPRINQELIRDMVKIQKFLATKVYAGIEASDAELEKYYQEHRTEFNKTEEILLYQILLDNRERAIKIRGELVNAPSRFEEVARAESKSVEAKEGGKMGLFERGQLPKEMEDVVFSLRRNEISPVVESPYGFHIFKVVQKSNPKQLSFFQVKEDLREKVLSQKTGAAYQDFLRRLKSETKIASRTENLFFPYQTSDGETK